MTKLLRHGIYVVAAAAAMAAIDSPPAKYQPRISPRIVKGYKTEDGTQVGISDIQLEAVAFAGHAHSQMLPNGQRKGFMIGDGTGGRVRKDDRSFADTQGVFHRLW